MNKLLRIILIIFSLLILIGVRYYEAWFYDPLRSYFSSGAYLHDPLPHLNLPLFTLHLSLRYLLNAGVSLVLINLWFPQGKYLKFSMYFYLLAWVILLPPYLWLASTGNREDVFVLFYLRRLLIQPVFVLLLIPAFYYKRKVMR